MLRRMLSTAILTVVMQGCWSAAPTFAQDQNGQTMQTEKKMGQTMMKDDGQMMNDQKHPHRMSKKKHGRKKSEKNSNKMKSAEPNRM